MLGLSEPALNAALKTFMWSTQCTLVLPVLCFRLCIVTGIYRAMMVTSIERGERAIVAMGIARKE